MMDLRADRVSMRWPLFSMRKRSSGQESFYSQSGVYLRVLPSDKGEPTVWDRDVVIYLASLLHVDPGLGPEMTVSVPELLGTASRGTGAQAYRGLCNALFRLRHSRLHTNIATPGGVMAEVRWLDHYSIGGSAPCAGDPRPGDIAVTLSDWGYACLSGDGELAAISPRYFRLTGGLERRLYELALDKCRDGPAWTVSLRALAKETGSNQGNLRRFKFDLKTIARQQRLPDLRMSLLDNPKGEDSVRFVRLA